MNSIRGPGKPYAVGCVGGAAPRKSHGRGRWWSVSSAQLNVWTWRLSLSEKLTSNTGEIDVGTLTGNDSIFVIPFFQRPYKWGPRKLEQLEMDLLSLVDGTDDVHFLGAIIFHGLPKNPSDPAAYELIDGQQRLTTIYLYMCAVVRTLIDVGLVEEAEALFRKYLVVSVGTYGKSNLKLQPSREDQGDLNAVIRDILGARNFDQHLAGFSFKPLAASGEARQRISKNYASAKRFLKRQLAEDGIERIRDLYGSLLQRMSVVQIDVKDPTNGPRIFDSLNSGQEPMTIGDLVRNDVFAKTAASDPDKAIAINDQYWTPFYARFKVGTKDYFDDFFFPFGLVHNPNLKKSEVYAALKKRWKDQEPAAVVGELAEYQNSFLDLRFGTNESEHPKQLARAFRRFHEMGAPSSVYPFLMRISIEVSRGSLNPTDAVGILSVIDSFLTRRAICGHEPTGLHAVFKGLWGDIKENPTAFAAAAVIAGKKTVVKPTDAEVTESITKRPIYGSAICRYVLRQLDESLGGDDVSSLPMWIEHVLPQSAKEWRSFSATEHARDKDLLANLIPLSIQMNQQLQNSPYDIKRPYYLDDSAFKSAREFAKSHSDWTPQGLSDRSKMMDELARSRWPDVFH